MMSADEAAAASLAALHKELVETIPSMVRKACSEMQFQTQFVTSPLITIEAIEAIVGEGYTVTRTCGGNIVVFTLSWFPTAEDTAAMLNATVPLDPVQQLSVDATNIEAKGFLARICAAAEKGKWEYSEMLNKALTIDVLQKRLGSAYKVSHVKDYADGTHLVYVYWHLTPEQAEAHLMAKEKK
jgi:hypothetical protein